MLSVVGHAVTVTMFLTRDSSVQLNNLACLLQSLLVPLFVLAYVSSSCPLYLRTIRRAPSKSMIRRQLYNKRSQFSTVDKERWVVPYSKPQNRTLSGALSIYTIHPGGNLKYKYSKYSLSKRKIDESQNNCTSISWKAVKWQEKCVD